MMRTRLLLLWLAAIFLWVPGQASAQELAGILPVVGSTPGAQGAQFKTGLQMTNPGASLVRGELVYRPQGGGPEVRETFEIAPRATVAYDDVVADMGSTGLGSLEIVVTEGARPVVVARAFADGEGTRGVTVPLVLPEQALETGESATLLAPSDLVRFRFNVGVRALESGATLALEVFDEDGSLLASRSGLTYDPNGFEQKPANEFAGVEIGENQSLRIEVISGSVIVYGTSTDNTTNDPSFQLDELLNKPPVLVEQRLLDQEDGTVRIELRFEDPDGDPIEITVDEHPELGTLGAFAEEEEGWFAASYAPGVDHGGRPDRIIIIVTDGQGNVIVIIINIPGGRNRAPTANDQTVSTDEDVALQITLSGSDPDGDALAFSIASGPTRGDLGPITQLSPTTARARYTPRSNLSGPDSFTFEVNDGRGGTDTGEVEITVRSVNDAPVAAADGYTVLEDSVLTVVAPGVLGNDTDVEGSALTAALVSGPTNGSLALAGDGSFTYTPSADFYGTDAFTYEASDGLLSSGPATVTITVTAVNDAPAGNPDSYGPVAHGTTLTVAAPGVVGNDTDVDADALSAILVTGPSFASAFTLNADGSFSYTHDRSANLSDSFTYNVSDGTAGPVGPITVSITIAANLAPVATDDVFGVDEGGTLNVAAAGVMTNDADPEGFPISAALVSGPSRGLLTFNANGSFDYVHDGSSTTSDSFTYRVTDGLLSSGVATVTITITPVNDAPVAAPNSYSVARGGTLTVLVPGVLGNDTDEEGDPLTAALVAGPGSSAAFTLNADGSFSYTHDSTAGTSDSFTYQASDGADLSNVATVTIAITNVNQAPTANDDAYSVSDGGTLTIAAPGVIANDTDPEGNPMTAILDAGPSSATSLTLNADGSFSYQHDGSGAGTDTFTYHVNDGAANSNVATVTITITAAANVAPVATGDAYAIAQGGTLTIVAPGVLGNDTDAELNPLSAALVTGPTRGALTLNSDGSFTYVHGGSSTLSDSFTYVANDGQADSNVATVTITINAVNTAPTAVDDAYGTSQNLPLNVPAPGVLGNDTDPEGDALTPILGTGPSNGVLTLNADGSFTYIPAADFFGSDSYTYFAFDGALQSATAATVSITVDPNAVPVANDDAYATDEDTPLTVAAPGVLGNDTDGDSDPLTAAVVTGPSNAMSFTFNLDGSFDYSPAADFNGTDTFTYRANDSVADSNLATVTITVAPVDDAPVAVDDAATVTEDDPATTFDVLANDTDVDGGPKSIQSVTQPANGTVVITNAGADLTYEPDADYCNDGSPLDTFTYTLNGGSVGTVSITVTCVDDDPVAVADAATVVEDSGANTIDVLANDTDVDGGPKSIQSATDPANGTVVITNAGADLTYEPDADYCNDGSPTDDFTYTLNGGSTATVAVTVTCVDDPPLAVADAATVVEDSGANTFDVLANDTDIDGGPKTIQSVTQPTNGAVVITNAGADLTYAPNLNYCNDGSPTDTFTYTLNGGSTATVAVTVTCVNDPPVGGTDSWETFGNTTLVVDQAALSTPHVLDTTTSTNGALDNDSDPVEGDAVVVTGIVGCADASAPFGDGPVCNTTAGGAVVMQSNGRFTYTPQAGDTGADSFQYVLTDVPSVGTPASVNVLVNLTLHEVIWYVDGSVGGPGTGVSTDPFNNFASLNGAGGVGDADAANAILFVHDSTVAGSIELENGEKLWGEGFGLSINRNLNGNGAPTTLVAAGTKPLVESSTGNTVTVTANTANGDRSGIEILGLTLATTAALSNAIEASSANAAVLGLLVNDVVIGGATAEGIDIDQASTGTSSVTVTNVDVTAGGFGVSIARAAGALNLALTNITVGGDSGAGISVVGPVAFSSPTLGSIVVGASGNPVTGAGVEIGPYTGLLTTSNLQVFAGGGAGLRAVGSGVVASGLTTPASSVVSATGGPAVDLSNLTANTLFNSITSASSLTTGVSLTNVNGTFTAESGSSMTNATGTDFAISGGTANVTYRGTITDDLGQLVSVSGATGGTKSFEGAITDGNDGDGSGISLTSNTGATINFSGGLTLSTGANPAFTATGGGTVNVTGTNTVATTTGIAVNVANTIIGGSDLNFRSVSSNGASSGIVLNNTGTSGGLTVTGDGGVSNNGSGGTIQNTSGAAVSLNNTKDTSLNYVNITNPGTDGIRITDIDGFTLNRSTITDGAGTAPADKTIDIGDFVTGTPVDGAITISNSILGPASGNAPHDTLAIGISSGTSNWMITGTTFLRTGNSGINLEARGSSTATISVTGSTFAGAGSTVSARGIFANTLDDSVLDFTVSGNTFTNNNIHIDLNQQNDTDPVGSHTFSVMNNTTMTGANSHAMNIFAAAGSFGGTFTGNIEGNVIGNAGVASSGSVIGNGIRVNINGGSDATIRLNNNTIRQTPNGRGIEIIGRNGTGGLDVTVTQNDVNPQDTSGFPLAAILVQSNCLTICNTVRSNVTGNIVPAATDVTDLLTTYIQLVESSTSTLELVDTTAPISGTCASELAATNTGSTGVLGGCALIAGPISTP